MNAEIKQDWIDALRSGKYKQGHGALRHGDEFCCLGVLCDLHQKATKKHRWVTRKDTSDRYYAGSFGLLPEEVAEWAGVLRDPKDSERKQLSAHNDWGKSFEAIAAIIERDF